MENKPSSGENGAPGRKPWPMSWVLIVILLYILFQTAYFLFFSGK